MTYQQLELWNDNPEPWQEKMKRDALAIAFPEANYDDVKVEIESSWLDAIEAGGQGNCHCCFDSWDAEDANFWFEVSWRYKSGRRIPSSNNPLNLRPAPREVYSRRFERDEAVQFFQELMSRGSV